MPADRSGIGAADKFRELADGFTDAIDGSDETENRNRPDEDVEQGITPLQAIVVNLGLIVEDRLNLLLLRHRPQVEQDAPDALEDHRTLKLADTPCFEVAA